MTSCNIHWRFLKCRWICVCFLTESLLWCIDVSIKSKGHSYSWQDATAHCQAVNFPIRRREIWIFSLLCRFSVLFLLLCFNLGSFFLMSSSSLVFFFFFFFCSFWFDVNITLCVSHVRHCTFHFWRFGLSLSCIFYVFA